MFVPTTKSNKFEEIWQPQVVFDNHDSKALLSLTGKQSRDADCVCKLNYMNQ